MSDGYCHVISTGKPASGFQYLIKKVTYCSGNRKKDNVICQYKCLSDVEVIPRKIGQSSLGHLP